MKILVISAEVWRNDKNEGNLFSDIFGDTGYEFAQICSNQRNTWNKNLEKQVERRRTPSFLRGERVCQC